MGTVAVMNKSQEEMIRAVAGGEVEGLRIVHKPIDSRGEKSLWPVGVTSGTEEAFGWFEAPNFIHFWGGSPWDVEILAPLKKAGIYPVEFF